MVVSPFFRHDCPASDRHPPPGAPTLITKKTATYKDPVILPEQVPDADMILHPLFSGTHPISVQQIDNGKAFSMC